MCIESVKRNTFALDRRSCGCIWLGLSLERFDQTVHGYGRMLVH